MWKHLIWAALTVVWVAGCQAPVASESKPDAAKAVGQIDAATERDHIFSMLAYSVVLKDWQDADMKNNRGYNIGSVLVNERNEPVWWARNRVNATRNGTQHGEVRCIVGYLNSTKIKKLRKHTIYTTLEPCAMCSGMMVMTELPRTVYGQTDRGFGKALERLKLDSTQLKYGHKPYPRAVESVRFSGKGCVDLNRTWDAYAKKYPNPNLVVFLASEAARKIYEEEHRRLISWKVQHDENKAIYQSVRTFLSNVPGESKR